MEAGTQQAGQPCDTGDRTRGGQNCDPASICTVAAGAMTGACAALCDPRSILTRPPGDTSGCALGTDCRDASDVTVFNDGTTAPATVGFCAAVTACRVLGANACPQGGAEPEGCTPTNPVRATGVCDPGADGPLGAGATCEVMPATPAGECAAGTICFGRSATDLTCETLCDLGAMPTVVCPGATTCQTVRWSAGLDGATGTPDDVFALSWGTCQ